MYTVADTLSFNQPGISVIALAVAEPAASSSSSSAKTQSSAGVSAGRAGSRRSGMVIRSKATWMDNGRWNRIGDFSTL